MNTKIDISSLDEATKNEIEKMRKRCKELDEGVQESTTIKDILKLHWDDMEKLMNELKAKIENELKAKIDEEIKNIIIFSNNVADQLGVDRTEFFNQYFAA